MKKVSRFNAAMALGSLTAAVALLAGAPAASAQQAPGSDVEAGQPAAPGGGSFPGSFLIPGTNSSLKIGGFAKWDAIYDMSSSLSFFSPQVIIPFAIPLNGTAGHQIHGNFMNEVRQSNINIDVRTPTSYGEMEVFGLMDFFGNQTSNNFSLNGVDSWTQRVVLFYGSLGPLMAGQTLSLWFDGDALGESVDPTAAVGTNDGLSNRHTTIRYTYAGAGGLSAAVAVEQPNSEGFTNAGLPASAAGATGLVQSLNTAATAGGGGTFANLGLSGGWTRVPDGIARVRLDQAWGHVAATFVVRDQSVRATGVRFGTTGYGGELTGHLNTFGKDTLRGAAMVGRALGSYLSDMGSNAGIQVASVSGAATACTTATNISGECVGRVGNPLAWGVYASYTHWWTDELRSSVAPGFSHTSLDRSIISDPNAQNVLDHYHIGGTVNLIWSPVPQVDLGIEYDYIQRKTWLATNSGVGTGNNNKGQLQRIESEAVFKF